MKWVLGVDALQRARGAVAFADWLVHNGEGELIAPVHILELIEGAEGLPDFEPFRAWSTREAEAILGERDWGKLGTLEAIPAEKGLTHALDDLAGDALIVGRRATMEGHQVVRLGRVARRLARELPAPLVVVPADYSPDLEAHDPIVLGTDLTDASASAAGFARKLARSTGRPLVAVHAVEGPDLMAAYLPERVWRETSEQLHGTARERLNQWCDAHGLGDAARRVEDGPTESALLTVSDDIDAAVVVLGSRRLSTADRVFTASTASGVAAHSRVPVAIVPPPDTQ